MKLASLKDGSRDGCLVVVSRDLSRCLPVPEVAKTLQAALDDWAEAAPALAAAAAGLEADASRGQAFDPSNAHAPLPRAYQWADGSAYLNHVELVRQARGAKVPETFYSDPLMYQGGSDVMIGPRDPILVADEAYGIDMEAEVAVIVDDVPAGVSVAAAAGHIKLIMLVNDVSLRNLIAPELAKGFGFFQSKPPTAFSPTAITPDELGAAWQDGSIALPLRVDYNGAPFGRALVNQDMTFSLPQLVAHAAKTRPLSAGSIIGSGTISNKLDGGPGKLIADGGVGYSCLAELRMVETIQQGAAQTPFMRFGDRVRIEMLDAEGRDLFGAIDQGVEQAG
jgi:fumarylacetoacetate (FAA) hydrolase